MQVAEEVVEEVEEGGVEPFDEDALQMDSGRDLDAQQTFYEQDIKQVGFLSSFCLVLMVMLQINAGLS